MQVEIALAFRMDVEAIIGWNLRRIRGEQGLSQEELALRINIIDQAYISRVESGRKNPTAVMLYLLASALSVGVGEFFSLDSIPKKLTSGPVIIRSSRSKKTDS